METQEQLSKRTKKVLREMTGEPKTSLAIDIALRDSIRLKIDEIERKINSFEKKYGCNFSDFEKKWKKSGDYSYEKEKELLEWDSLVFRKKHLLELLQELS